MKTWQQLADLAKSDNLKFHRAHGGVTIYTTDGMSLPMVSITPGELEDDDADMVVRSATEAALRALRNLNT